jgi:DNA-binding LytR/AlgR family response regulator
MRISFKSLAIVEDDELIAHDLKAMVNELGFEVLWMAYDATKAMEFAKEQPPLLVLMDINLNDILDGVHLAGIFKTEYRIPVIFTSAFSDSETIKRVGNISPLGYVLKPYTLHTLKVAIELAGQKLNNDSGYAESKDQGVFIESVQGLVRLVPEDIYYIEAFDYYSHIYTLNGKITAKYTLKDVLEIFRDSEITRFHKSYAVNKSHIIKIFDNHVYVMNQRLPVGRAFKQHFYQLLSRKQE